jgi:hypothetical protein
MLHVDIQKLLVDINKLNANIHIYIYKLLVDINKLLTYKSCMLSHITDCQLTVNPYEDPG